MGFLDILKKAKDGLYNFIDTVEGKLGQNEESYQDLQVKKAVEDSTINAGELEQGIKQIITPVKVIPKSGGFLDQLSASGAEIFGNAKNIIGGLGKVAGNVAQQVGNIAQAGYYRASDIVNPTIGAEKEKQLEIDKNKEEFDNTKENFKKQLGINDTLNSLGIDFSINEDKRKALPDIQQKKYDEDLQRLVELKSQINSQNDGINFMNEVNEIEKIYGNGNLDKIDQTKLPEEQKQLFSYLKDVVDGGDKFVEQAIKLIGDVDTLEYVKKNGISSAIPYLSTKYGVPEKEVKAMLKNDIIKKSADASKMSEEYAGIVNDLRTRDIIYDAKLDRGTSGTDRNADEEITNRYAGLFNSNGIPLSNSRRKTFSNYISIGPKEQNTDKAALQNMASSFIQDGIDMQIGENIWEGNVPGVSKSLKEQSQDMLSAVGSQEFQAYKNKVKDMVMSGKYGTALDFDETKFSNDLATTQEQINLQNMVGNKKNERSVKIKGLFTDQAMKSGDYLDGLLGKGVNYLAGLKTTLENDANLFFTDTEGGDTISKYVESGVRTSPLSIFATMFENKNADVSDDFLIAIKNRDESYRQNDFNQAINSLKTIWNTASSSPISLAATLATLPVGGEMGLLGKFAGIEGGINKVKSGIQLSSALEKNKILRTLGTLGAETTANVAKNLPLNLAFESMLSNPKADASWFFVPDILFGGIAGISALRNRGFYRGMIEQLDDVKKTMDKIPEGTEGYDKQLGYLLSTKTGSYLPEQEAISLYKKYTAGDKQAAVDFAKKSQNLFATAAKNGGEKQVFIDGFVRGIANAIDRSGLSGESINELESTAKLIGGERYNQLVQKYAAPEFEYLTDQQRKVAPISEILLTEAKSIDNYTKHGLIKQAVVFGENGGAFDGLNKIYDDMRASVMKGTGTPEEKQRMTEVINQSQGKRMQTIIAVLSGDKTLMPTKFSNDMINEVKELGAKLGVNVDESTKRLGEIADENSLHEFISGLGRGEIAEMNKEKGLGIAGENLSPEDIGNKDVVNLLDTAKGILGGTLDVKLISPDLVSDVIKAKGFLFYIDKESQIPTLTIVGAIQEVGKNEGMINNLSAGISDILWKGLNKETKLAIHGMLISNKGVEGFYDTLNKFLGESVKGKQLNKISEELFAKIIDNYIKGVEDVRSDSVEFLNNTLGEGTTNLSQSDKAMGDIISSISSVVRSTLGIIDDSIAKIQNPIDTVLEQQEELNMAGVDFFEMARVYSLDYQHLKVNEIYNTGGDRDVQLNNLVAFISFEQAISNKYLAGMKKKLKDSDKYNLFLEAADRRILLHKRGIDTMLDNIAPYINDETEQAFRIKDNKMLFDSLMDMSVNISEDGYMSTPIVDFFRNMTKESQKDLGGRIITNMFGIQGIDQRAMNILSELGYDTSQGFGSSYIDLLGDVENRINKYLSDNNDIVDYDYASKAEDMANRMFVGVNNYVSRITEIVTNNPEITKEQLINQISEGIIKNHYDEAYESNNIFFSDMFNFSEGFLPFLGSEKKLNYNLLYANLSNAAMGIIRDLPEGYVINLKEGNLSSYIGKSLGKYDNIIQDFINSELQDLGIAGRGDLKAANPEKAAAISNASSYDQLLAAVSDFFTDDSVKLGMLSKIGDQGKVDMLSKKLSNFFFSDGKAKGYKDIDGLSDFIEKKFIDRYTKADTTFTNLDTAIYKITSVEKTNQRIFSEESEALPNILVDEYYKQKYKLFDGVDKEGIPIVSQGDFTTAARKAGVPEKEILYAAEVIASKKSLEVITEEADRIIGADGYKQLVNEIDGVNETIKLGAYGRTFLSKDTMARFISTPGMSEFLTRKVKFLGNRELATEIEELTRGIVKLGAGETHEGRIVEGGYDVMYNSDRNLMENHYYYTNMHKLYLQNKFLSAEYLSNPNTIAAYGGNIGDVIELSARGMSKQVQTSKTPNLVKLYNLLSKPIGKVMNARAAMKLWYGEAEKALQSGEIASVNELIQSILFLSNKLKDNKKEYNIYMKNAGKKDLLAAAYLESYRAINFVTDDKIMVDYLNKSVSENNSSLKSTMKKSFEALNSMTSLWFFQDENSIKKLEAFGASIGTNSKIFNNLLLNTMHDAKTSWSWYAGAWKDYLFGGVKGVERISTKAMFFNLYHPLFGSEKGLIQAINNIIHDQGKVHSQIAGYDTSMSDDIVNTLSEVVSLTYVRSEISTGGKSVGDQTTGGFISSIMDSAFGRVVKKVVGTSSLEIADNVSKNKVIRTALASVMSVAGYTPESAVTFFKDAEIVIGELRNSGVLDYVSTKEFFNRNSNSLEFYLGKRMSEAGKPVEEINNMLAHAVSLKGSLSEFGTIMQKAKTQAAVFYQMDSNPLLQKSRLLANENSWMFMRFLSWSSDKSGEYIFRLQRAIGLKDKMAISQIFSEFLLQGLKAAKITSQIDRVMSGEGEEGASWNDTLGLLYLPYTLVSMMTLNVIPGLVDAAKEAETMGDFMDGMTSLFNDTISNQIPRRLLVGTLWAGARIDQAINTADQAAKADDMDLIDSLLVPITKVIENSLFKNTASYYSDTAAGIYSENNYSSISRFVPYLFGNKNVSEARKENQRIMNKLYSINSEDDAGGLGITIIPYRKNAGYEALLLDKYYKDKQLKVFEIGGSQLTKKLEELNGMMTADKQEAIYKTLGYDNTTPPEEIDDGTDIKLSTAQASVPVYDIILKGLIPSEGTKEQKAYYTIGAGKDSEVKVDTIVKDIFDKRQKVGEKNPKLLKTFDELKITEDVTKLTNRFGEATRMGILMKAMVTINTKIIKDNALLKEGGKSLFKSAESQANQAELVAGEVRKMKLGLVSANYDTILAANKTVGKNMLTAYYTADNGKGYPIKTMISPKNTIGAYEIGKMNQNIVEYQGLGSYGMNNSMTQLTTKLFSNALGNKDETKKMKAITNVLKNAVNIVEGTEKDYGKISGMGVRLGFVMGLAPFYSDLATLAKTNENAKEFMEKTSKDWARALDVITVSEPISDEKIKEIELDMVTKDPKGGGGKKGRIPSVNFENITSGLNKLRKFSDDLKLQTHQAPNLSNKQYYYDGNGSIKSIKFPGGARRPEQPEYIFVTPVKPKGTEGKDLKIGRVTTKKIQSNFKPRPIKYSKEYKRIIRK